uniref:Uncharacterized protein n=1 Tax=Oryza brachyantha TaxID=4533 RepID=J3L696_ORYBR
MESRERYAIGGLPQAQAEPSTGLKPAGGRGGWPAALFLIAVGFLERTGLYGVQGNLIMYFTGPLGMSTAAAAAGVNAWAGTAYVMPLLGAMAADSWIGRGNIFAFSLSFVLLAFALHGIDVALAAALYDIVIVRFHAKDYENIITSNLIIQKGVTLLSLNLGLGMLTVSSMLPPVHDQPAPCQDDAAVVCSSPAAPAGRVAFFYVGLYLLALAQGFHGPCAEAIGADQFPESSSARVASRSSFFNWFHFSMAWGYAVSSAGMSYVQDNVGWPVGFGACWAVMLVSLSVFLLGTGTYRPEEPRRGARTFAETAKGWTAVVLRRGDAMDDTTSLLTPSPSGRGADKGIVAKLLPIWMTSVVYAVIIAQMTTFFTKQGSTMDRRIDIGTGGAGFGFVVPAAALQCFVSVAVMATIPYALVGVANMLALVGLEELFYDQVPGELRSVGLAACTSIMGAGSYVSSVLVSAIDWATRSRGESWFSDNLNRAHIDYFYCFLVGISALESLGTLTISSLTQATDPHPVSFHDATTACSSPPPPSPARLVFFNAALYLLALAQGFHNPCSLAFGADQFAPSDPSARASRSSYFNWYHFFNSCGYALSNTVLSYVEDSVSWTVGFAACLAMTAVYLPVFLLGTPAYRAEQPVDGGLLAQLADKYRAWTARVFPRKEAICTERLLAKEEVEVEDGNGFVVKLLPIWVTSIVFATVVSQQSTLFTKQGSTMDRRIGARGGGGFVVPPAALQLAVSVTMLTLLPIYDRALVPLARRFTGHPAGITTLQRIGAGMAYVLVGLARAFGDIGLDEFFYDQVPGGLRSVGLAMSLSVRGVGSYASGVLVSGIDWATTRGGGESWFSDNLNRAHLDYFYGILAAVAALEVAVFLYVAKRYVYRYKGEP